MKKVRPSQKHQVRSVRPRAKRDQDVFDSITLDEFRQKAKTALHRAIERLELEAPQKEKDRFYEATKENSIETWKWLFSLLALDDYHKQGEHVLFSQLYSLLLFDFAFFIQQWWIIDLLASWYEAGEQEKINQLLFGSTKGKRTPGFSLLVQNHRRDTTIFFEVERLIEEKAWSKNKAYKWVSDNWKVLGLKEKTSARNVRKIHEEFLKKKDPFLSLFSPSY